MPRFGITRHAWPGEEGIERRTKCAPPAPPTGPRIADGGRLLRRARYERLSTFDIQAASERDSSFIFDAKLRLQVEMASYTSAYRQSNASSPRPRCASAYWDPSLVSQQLRDRFILTGDAMGARLRREIPAAAMPGRKH